MSEDNVQKVTLVTAQQIKEFFSVQEVLIQRAIKRIDIIDKGITKIEKSVKDLFNQASNLSQYKKDHPDCDMIKININLVKISMRGKKEKQKLNKFQIIRKQMSSQMDDLVESLDGLRQIAELKGITL